MFTRPITRETFRLDFAERAAFRVAQRREDEDMVRLLPLARESLCDMIRLSIETGDQMPPFRLDESFHLDAGFRAPCVLQIRLLKALADELNAAAPGCAFHNGKGVGGYVAVCVDKLE